MEDFSRDIYPDLELVQIYEPVRPLLDNRVLARAFENYESRAVYWKMVYRSLGAISLSCIGLAALYMGYRLTLEPLYGSWRPAASIGTVVGVIGLTAQLIVIVGQVRDRWLVARFAAERLRCLKFQAFQVLAGSSNLASLQADVQSYTSERIARLMQEIRGGRTAIMQFDPSAALGEAPKTSKTGSREFLHVAQAAYDALRFDVQLQHFTGRIEAALEDERTPAAVGDWTFVIAAFLTLLDLALQGFAAMFPEHAIEISPALQAWWELVVWALFVTSSVLTIFGQARVQRVDADRYEQYRKEIALLKARPVEGWPGFIASVHDMELIALREIRDFCRDQRFFGYIF